MAKTASNGGAPPSLDGPGDWIAQSGLRLRWLRLEMGISQAQLAAALHVHPSTLNKWEYGHRLPGPYAMVLFCDQFRASLDYIYRGKLDGLDQQLALRLAARYPRLVLGAEDHAANPPPSQVKPAAADAHS